MYRHYAHDEAVLLHLEARYRLTPKTTRKTPCFDLTGRAGISEKPPEFYGF